jgi:hypothetical protein
MRLPQQLFPGLTPLTSIPQVVSKPMQTVTNAINHQTARMSSQQYRIIPDTLSQLPAHHVMSMKAALVGLLVDSIWTVQNMVQEAVTLATVTLHCRLPSLVLSQVELMQMPKLRITLAGAATIRPISCQR